jgi:2'-5' RNA ligase
MPTRTFLAIELDDATRAFISAQMQPLQAALPRVRFVGSDTWHITLAFLGDLDDAQLTASFVAADAAAGASKPFTLRAGGIGSFGTEAAPRVIWIGVAGDRAALDATQAHVAQEIRSQGLPMRAEHHYSPHITLARLKQPLAPEEIAALRAARASQAHGPELPVRGISVMRSQLSPAGARYTRMHYAPFA